MQYKLALAHYRLSIFTYAKLNFHFNFHLQLLVAIATILLLRYLPSAARATWTVCRYFDRQSSPLSRGEERKSFSSDLCFIRCFAWVRFGLDEGQQKGLGHSPQAFAGLGSGELCYPVVTSALCNLIPF